MLTPELYRHTVRSVSARRMKLEAERDHILSMAHLMVADADFDRLMRQYVDVMTALKGVVATHAALRIHHLA